MYYKNNFQIKVLLILKYSVFLVELKLTSLYIYLLKMCVYVKSLCQTKFISSIHITQENISNILQLLKKCLGLQVIWAYNIFKK